MVEHWKNWLMRSRLALQVLVMIPSYMVKELQDYYGDTIPEESQGLLITKAALANRRLRRFDVIPGAEVTPDQLCQKGLIHFDNGENWLNIGRYFRIPYIWLLALCVTYRDNQFFQELQMIDYRDFQSKHNGSMSEQFSLSAFMKLMVKIQKIKSHVFNNGANVTGGDIHKGAIMNACTRYNDFTNHHLDNDVAVHHILRHSPFK